jgi:hypothetical protein
MAAKTGRTAGERGPALREPVAIITLEVWITENRRGGSASPLQMGRMEMP